MGTLATRAAETLHAAAITVQFASVSFAAALSRSSCIVEQEAGSHICRRGFVLAWPAVVVAAGCGCSCVGAGVAVAGASHSAEVAARSVCSPDLVGRLQTFRSLGGNCCCLEVIIKGQALGLAAHRHLWQRAAQATQGKGEWRPANGAGIALLATLKATSSIPWMLHAGRQVLATLLPADC